MKRTQSTPALSTMATRQERFRRASLEFKNPVKPVVSPAEDISLAETEELSDFDDSTYSQNNFGHLAQHKDKPQLIIKEEEIVTIPTKTDKPKSALKKSASAEDIPICRKSRSWSVLPVPEVIKTEVVPAAVQENHRSRRMRRNVSFDDVLIREYQQTIGDNPSVGYGPPISLDWDYEEMEAIPVEQWEDNRGKRRTPQELLMNYYTRRNLLTLYGYSDQELKQAKRDVAKAQRKRAATKYFLPYQKLEDMAESVGRKSMRAVGIGKKQPQAAAV